MKQAARAPLASKPTDLDGTIQVSEFDSFSESYQALLGESVAITGESGEYFAACKADFVAANVMPVSDCKILDYGCGIGMVSARLKERFLQAQIDGYDVSRASLDRVPPALRAQGLFASDIADLNPPYDVVVMANVLHHVEPGNRLCTVRQAAALLGTNGKMIVFEHNPANPLTRRAVRLCPFDENATLLPAQETKQCLARTGFESVRVNYIVFFPRALNWLRPLEKALGWFPLGAQYAAVGSFA